jgi:hypothetical protein
VLCSSGSNSPPAVWKFERFETGRHQVDYQVESVTSARSTSDDDVYGMSSVDLLNEPMVDDLDLDEDGGVSVIALVAEEPTPIGEPRLSYGIADILFPMTPPKPKGARLIRGPLRFN